MRKFRRKPVDVEALQHDGTLERAKMLVEWVTSNGGNAAVMDSNEADYLEPPVYYVKLVNSKALTIVPPGFWIDRVPTGHFYVVTDDDFKHLYDPVDAPTNSEEAGYDDGSPFIDTHCANCSHDITDHRRMKSDGSVFCLISCPCREFFLSIA